LKFVEDNPVVDALDPHLAPIAFVKQLPASFLHGSQGNRPDTEKHFNSGEIDSRLPFLRLDLEPDYVFRVRLPYDRPAKEPEVIGIVQTAEGRGPIRRDRRKRPPHATEEHELESKQAR